MRKRPFIPPVLRASIAAFVASGATYKQAAEAFQVGIATVNRIWRRFRETGSTEMAPRGGGQRPGIPEQQQDEFRKLVEDNSDATYDELTVLWNRQAQRRVSRSVIVRMAKKLRFTRKKKTVLAQEKKLEKNIKKTKIFRRKIRATPPSKLVYLDESGFSCKLRRDYARSLRGEKAKAFYPCTSGKNITVCGAVRSTGPVIMEGRPRSMTRKWFCIFLRTQLFPRLVAGDSLVLDNLSAHHGAQIRRLARKWKIRLIYLPPYSPEFNAIEAVWAWMKNRLRARVNRIASNFRYQISGAWRKVASLDLPAFVAAAAP